MCFLCYFVQFKLLGRSQTSEFSWDSAESQRHGFESRLLFPLNIWFSFKLQALALLCLLKAHFNLLKNMSPIAPGCFN